MLGVVCALALIPPSIAFTRQVLLGTPGLHCKICRSGGVEILGGEIGKFRLKFADLHGDMSIFAFSDFLVGTD